MSVSLPKLSKLAQKEFPPKVKSLGRTTLLLLLLLLYAGVGVADVGQSVVGVAGTPSC